MVRLVVLVFRLKGANDPSSSDTHSVVALGSQSEAGERKGLGVAVLRLCVFLNIFK